jgi:hypothetical protein
VAAVCGKRELAKQREQSLENEIVHTDRGKPKQADLEIRRSVTEGRPESRCPDLGLEALLLARAHERDEAARQC